MILTRLDVLDGISPIKICTGYRLDGKTINHFPTNNESLERCEPIYEDVQGWQEPTASVKSLDKLPDGARHYIKRIEDLIGVPIHMISTGPNRDETIMIKNIIS